MKTATIPPDSHVAVIGGGVIGGGWVARFALMGCDVKLYDPDPEAERKVSEILDLAKASLPDLYDQVLPAVGEVSVCKDLASAVVGAVWVCESVPEELSLKRKVFREIEALCDQQCIVASSTSGFKPSQLASGLKQPGRLIVAHPFNPVYLIPLVELVGDDAAVIHASTFLAGLGMQPLRVRHEIDAHIADRLLEAVWREALWLVEDGIATTREIDDAIRYGFGLRWAQMGLFETYRIAGGEKGMAHFIKQFGPALNWPWSRLVDVPELSDELVNTIAEQSDEQSGHWQLRQLESIRDRNLVSILRGLKQQNWGAGELLNQTDILLADEPMQLADKRVNTLRRSIPRSWTDYNGHMNDSRYGELFSKAVDQLLTFAGAGQDYLEAGFSFFTVNTQIDYLREVHAGQVVRVLSQVESIDGKKLSVRHVLFDNDLERELANCRQLLLHVELKTRRSCEPEQALAAKLAALMPSVDVFNEVNDESVLKPNS